MDLKEAIKILDPETTREAIAEIEYYAGFNHDKVIEKVNEACEVACKIMKDYKDSNKQIINDFANQMRFEYRESIGVPKQEKEFANAIIDMVEKRLENKYLDSDN